MEKFNNTDNSSLLDNTDQEKLDDNEKSQNDLSYTDFLEQIYPQLKANKEEEKKENDTELS